MSYILSRHFTLSEFTDSETAKASGIANDPSAMAKTLASNMCVLILEPIRERFGPVVITSGYRSPELNAAVHGVSTSQHIWTSEHVACDFQTPDAALDAVFDWIRLESHLPFDQVIREHGSKGGGDCIHISYATIPRRMALLGATHNTAPYSRVEVIA